ncbi:MAG: hypothetical protein ACI8XO_004751 [Verrucomicrobiales bacterium]
MNIAEMADLLPHCGAKFEITHLIHDQKMTPAGSSRKSLAIRLLVVLFVLLGLATAAFFYFDGARRIAIASAPVKTAKFIEGDKAKAAAEELFWETLRAGNYAGIGEAMTLLKASYLENPNDPEVALHIALTHLWRVAERFRLGEDMRPSVTDDMVLARKYFEEAKRLNPEDHRIDGWLAGAMMGEGHIHGDQRLTREGYFVGRRGVENYPAFNLFSLSFVMANQPHDSPRFAEAVEGLFESMDIANHAVVDRSNPTIANDLEVRESEGDADTLRAVTNTWKAPFNAEGFFLVLGDFLVKKGDRKAAEIVYKNAQFKQTYQAWPYRHLLEKRLKEIDQNVARFRDFNPTPEALMEDGVVDRTVIFNTYGCAICHQAK